MTEWIDRFESHTVLRSDPDADRVSTVIVGPTDGAPSAQSLTTMLSIEYDREMTADVRLIVEERDVTTRDQGGS